MWIGGWGGRPEAGWLGRRWSARRRERCRPAPVSPPSCPAGRPVAHWRIGGNCHARTEMIWGSLDETSTTSCGPKQQFGTLTPSLLPSPRWRRVSSRCLLRFPRRVRKIRGQEGRKARSISATTMAGPTGWRTVWVRCALIRGQPARGLRLVPVPAPACAPALARFR